MEGYFFSRSPARPCWGSLHTAPSIPGGSKPWVRARRASSLPADPRFEGENRSIALSRPYYVMGQVLVSRAGEGIRGLGDLKDKVVGVQAATPGDLLVVERGYQRRTYLTPEETFEAVRTRHVDAAVMWSPPAGWLAKKASERPRPGARACGGEVSF